MPALIGLATEEQKQQVQTLRTNILKLIDQQVALQRHREALAKRLRFVETVTFTPESGDLKQTHVSRFPSDSKALQTLQLVQLRTMFGIRDAKLPDKLVDLLRDSASLSASLDVVSSGKNEACKQAALDDKGCAAPKELRWGPKNPKAIPGIAFRSPVQARLLVCGDVRPEACSHGASQPILLDTMVSVPQMGRLAILPFHNGFGANNRLEAVFREDGSLDWLSYDAKEASGENLAKLLCDSSDQILAYGKERRKQQKLELEEARGAPAKALDNQIALLKKQQELAEVSVNDPDAAAQKQELTRLQAEIARLTALKQIKELDAALKANAES